MNEEIRLAIRKFESAVGNAWHLDTEDSFTDRNRLSTQKAHVDVDARRAELFAAIDRAIAHD